MARVAACAFGHVGPGDQPYKTVPWMVMSFMRNEAFGPCLGCTHPAANSTATCDMASRTSETPQPTYLQSCSWLAVGTAAPGNKRKGRLSRKANDRKMPQDCVMPGVAKCVSAKHVIPEGKA